LLLAAAAAGRAGVLPAFVLHWVVVPVYAVIIAEKYAGADHNKGKCKADKDGVAVV